MFCLILISDFFIVIVVVYLCYPSGCVVFCAILMNGIFLCYRCCLFMVCVTVMNGIFYIVIIFVCWCYFDACYFHIVCDCRRLLMLYVISMVGIFA